MRRFRQWLAETQDHMTESPDGGWAIYTEALADIEAAVHEWQDIAGQWEDKCQKLTEQIAALQREISRLYAALTAGSASITDLLNIYLRENGVTEIEHPTVPDIKAGIDRLAESAAHYKLHKEHQAEEIVELRFRVHNPHAYFLLEASKKDNCANCVNMHPATISHNEDRISCKYAEGWPHWSTKCEHWEKIDALNGRETLGGIPKIDWGKEAGDE